MRELLVIFHEATRTGSPVVTSRLLEHAKPHLEARIAVELLAGGPLEGHLRGLADTTAVTTPDAVLINSALGAAQALRFDSDIPVAVYVHEQGEALRTLPPSAIEALVDRADHLWCVSARSRADLAGLGVEDHLISLIPPVVAPGREVHPDEIAAVGEQLGMQPGSRLVVACGEANWRKGADMFTDICRRIAPEEPLHFAWIGRRQRAFGRILDHDTRALALQDRLTWTGEVDDPAPFLSAASLLVTPSREDPQPLVPLEASSYATPTVGFASGGLADMARHGAALTADYPDTYRLAHLAGEVLASPTTTSTIVASAQDFVERRHSLDAVGAAFLEELRELLDRRDAGTTGAANGLGTVEGSL